MAALARSTTAGTASACLLHLDQVISLALYLQAIRREVGHSAGARWVLRHVTKASSLAKGRDLPDDVKQS